MSKAELELRRKAAAVVSASVARPSEVETDEDVAGSPAAAPPDISNLQGCIDDVRRAGLDSDPGPAEPTDFHDLRGRLETCRPKLPPLYRSAVWTPYVSTLDQIGPNGFTD